ncbi:hypothetical protein [uncultured Pontibacter sp.]|uniref:hypothetical protein n=1 Tax=uncultured Pontibacter sp. TaxID=453356 RepID=UPI002632F62E|nr:hypothetical protein [uncultured Pontibacter sp.]
MKLSNKLLLGLFIVILLGATAVMGTAKYYGLDASVSTEPLHKAPAPPAPPAAE